MPSQTNTTTNLFSVLSPEEDLSPSQTLSDNEAPEPSRRQLKKAAKAEVAKAKAEEEAKSASAAAAAQKVDEKPAGWKASLTMAQIKALKQEEGLKKHAAMHPPKPASENAGTKGESSSASAKGKGKAAQHEHDFQTKPRSDIQHIVIPGCGLEGCPVEGRHPARPYTVDDYQLPSYVKTLYFQWPSPRDTEKVERFFRVHEETAGEIVKWTTKW